MYEWFITWGIWILVAVITIAVIVAFGYDHRERVCKFRSDFQTVVLRIMHRREQDDPATGGSVDADELIELVRAVSTRFESVSYSDGYNYLRHLHYSTINSATRFHCQEPNGDGNDMDQECPIICTVTKFSRAA
jgi:hypothetical protein